MPTQELFFEQQESGFTVQVLKSYDQTYAHEVFQSMDERATQRLWTVLKLEETYEPSELPLLNDSNLAAKDFLWDELLDQAREDGNTLSFFIVNETVSGRVQGLFVSPDWPSAEAYAKDRASN